MEVEAQRTTESEYAAGVFYLHFEQAGDNPIDGDFIANRSKKI
jgi:hypothetical protein